jgi:hypothetical protein
MIFKEKNNTICFYIKVGWIISKYDKIKFYVSMYNNKNDNL